MVKNLEFNQEKKYSEFKIKIQKITSAVHTLPHLISLALLLASQLLECIHFYEILLQMEFLDLVHQLGCPFIEEKLSSRLRSLDSISNTHFTTFHSKACR